MDELTLSKAFQLIEPGPVVLLTTAYRGKANVMTMSWHMVMEFTPLFGCIIGPGITPSTRYVKLKNASFPSLLWISQVMWLR
jgi:flavin reductase (DIM6/NTAB) family NADH-FMN oxidoreductase RutF